MCEARQRTTLDRKTYWGFGKEQKRFGVVVGDLSKLPATDEKALEVLVGTDSEKSKALKLESLLISTNNENGRDNYFCEEQNNIRFPEAFGIERLHAFDASLQQIQTPKRQVKQMLFRIFPPCITSE